MKVAGVGIATLGLTLGLSATQASAANPYHWYIKNAASGKCLEIPGGHDENGAPAQQWTCNGGDNQKWTGTQRTYGDGTVGWLYTNDESGKCLEVADWSGSAGAALRVWDCHAGDNQWWDDVSYSTGFAMINDNSRLAADMPGSSQADGTQAVQWYPKIEGQTSTANQRWIFESAN
ncbi:hypothetical protein AV521_34010 [Streptomyces sp. IMTB 2501]|nr:hypothetical protein AV521_34010 [Streptomyces sp. IMTB 2501]